MGARQNPRRRAQNLYKQVRLTYTEEASGRASVSIYAKPLNAQWTEQHLLYRWSQPGVAPASHLEDVVDRLIRILSSSGLDAG